MMRISNAHKTVAGVAALGSGLVLVAAGPAAARADFETDTTLFNIGDWDFACVRVDTQTNLVPTGSVKFRLKDRTSGDTESQKVKLRNKTTFARACWDISDYVDDGHRYRIRAVYQGFDNPDPQKPSYEPSSDKATFRYQE